MPDEPKYTIGDDVYKIGGDYRYEGVIVAVVRKLSGSIRYVIEDGRGLLFIFNEGSLGRRD